MKNKREDKKADQVEEENLKVSKFDSINMDNPRSKSNSQKQPQHKGTKKSEAEAFVDAKRPSKIMSLPHQIKKQQPYPQKESPIVIRVSDQLKNLPVDQIESIEYSEDESNSNQQKSKGSRNKRHSLFKPNKELAETAADQSKILLNLNNTNYADGDDDLKHKRKLGDSLNIDDELEESKMFNMSNAQYIINKETLGQSLKRKSGHRANGINVESEGTVNSKQLQSEQGKNQQKFTMRESFKRGKSNEAQNLNVPHQIDSTFSDARSGSQNFKSGKFLNGSERRKSQLSSKIKTISSSSKNYHQNANQYDMTFQPLKDSTIESEFLRRFKQLSGDLSHKNVMNVNNQATQSQVIQGLGDSAKSNKELNPQLLFQSQYNRRQSASNQNQFMISVGNLNMSNQGSGDEKPHNQTQNNQFQINKKNSSASQNPFIESYTQQNSMNNNNPGGTLVIPELATKKVAFSNEQIEGKPQFSLRALLIQISQTNLYRLILLGTTGLATLIDLFRVGFFDKRADVIFLVVTFILQAFLLMNICVNISFKTSVWKYIFSPNGLAEICFFVCNFLSSSFNQTSFMLFLVANYIKIINAVRVSEILAYLQKRWKAELVRKYNKEREKLKYQEMKKVKNSNRRKSMDRTLTQKVGEMLREKYAIDQYSRSKSESRRQSLNQSANQSMQANTALGISGGINTSLAVTGKGANSLVNTSHHGLRRSSTNLILQDRIKDYKGHNGNQQECSQLC
ncbi:hypothetical protein FGO68_gene6972 [Halteria grandinella]|uniref:Transmembrane protein n=1 Tax=Halteria grandinella TaxID=5974 RepID=A0A8J8NAK5_HALGN|nr:hypothetical protein FGO68_gene6972 [Halteria grandinella]